MAAVRIETPVNPSEDPAKVEAAVRNLFPDVVVRALPGALQAEGDDLKTFETLLNRQRILDAARHVMRKGVTEDGTSSTFLISKQAAAAGRVSFSVGEAPLGDLEVSIFDEDADARVRALAPRTRKGFPITEEEAAALEAREKQERDARKALGQEVEPDEEEPL
jgi:uncharacterized protein